MHQWSGKGQLLVYFLGFQSFRCHRLPNMIILMWKHWYYKYENLWSNTYLQCRVWCISLCVCTGWRSTFRPSLRLTFSTIHHRIKREKYDISYLFTSCWRSLEESCPIRLNMEFDSLLLWQSSLLNSRIMMWRVTYRSDYTPYYDLVLFLLLFMLLMSLSIV